MTQSATFPGDHPFRRELNDEVHARPSNGVATPVRASYLVMFCAAAEREAEWRHFCLLLAKYGQSSPVSPPTYHFAALGRFAIRYERHTEFSRYTITAESVPEDYFSTTALAELPQEWVGGLRGEVLVATHGVIVRNDNLENAQETFSAKYFSGNALIGSSVGDMAAAVYTDFRMRLDGFSRFIIVDLNLTPQQAGRILQQILEIDTYRMLALLALPVARTLSPLLTDYEKELSKVTQTLQTADTGDEATLLDRLTHLEAQIESEEVKNRYRFSAASAYYELVQRRIAELRESRILGLQTFGEFIERRLAPAMNTCRSVASRQESVSQHIARANDLLATRVDVTRQRQNQTLLESMNRRAKAQLELQQTVEGLSIAAITYYVVGLIGYVARGLHVVGLSLNYEVVMAVSIPIVAAALLGGLRLVHHSNRRKLTTARAAS